MTTDLNTAYKIVLGFDFSPTAVIALEQALEHAASRPRVILHALAVLDDHHGLARLGGQKKPNAELADQVQRELRAALNESIAASPADSLLVFAHVRIGHTADELLRLSDEAKADLLVVGTHGRRGVQRLVLGSVAGEIVRKATVPVLSARSPTYEGAMIGDEPEPPCTACATVRSDTGGATWWCGDHDKPYVPPHRYSYEPAIAQQPPRHNMPR